jgi:hypothetical protein
VTARLADDLGAVAHAGVALGIRVGLGLAAGLGIVVEPAASEGTGLPWAVTGRVIAVAAGAAGDAGRGGVRGAAPVAVESTCPGAVVAGTGCRVTAGAVLTKPPASPRTAIATAGRMS